MIKDNLRSLREHDGLSQAELARRLGISHQRYNYYESGRSEPDQQMLKHIAEYYGIPASELLVDLTEGATTLIRAQLPPRLAEYIEGYASTQGKTVSEAITLMLMEYYEREHGPIEIPESEE
jgi:transcriptional regulator with XRE-family HTH domain